MLSWKRCWCSIQTSWDSAGSIIGFFNAFDRVKVTGLAKKNQRILLIIGILASISLSSFGFFCTPLTWTTLMFGLEDPEID
jgi:hypothetical protein